MYRNIAIAMGAVYVFGIVGMTILYMIFNGFKGLLPTSIEEIWQYLYVIGFFLALRVPLVGGLICFVSSLVLSLSYFPDWVSPAVIIVQLLLSIPPGLLFMLQGYHSQKSSGH